MVNGVTYTFGESDLLDKFGITTHNSNGEVAENMGYGIKNMSSIWRIVMKKYAIREYLDSYIVLVPMAGLTASDFVIKIKDNVIYINFMQNMENKNFKINKEYGSLCHICEDLTEKCNDFEHDFDALRYTDMKIHLEKKINNSSITSSFEDGLLRLDIPKFEQSKKIEVK